MAYKGDFKECEKCTSFQCTTCGLDQLNKGSGDVSVVLLTLKTSAFMALLIILAQFERRPEFPLFFILGPIVSAIICLYLLITNKAQVGKGRLEKAIAFSIVIIPGFLGVMTFIKAVLLK